MSQSNDPNLQERLRQLEAELNAQSPPRLPSASEAAQSQAPEPTGATRLNRFSLSRLSTWFNDLSGGVRTVVALGGVVAGLMVLGAVLKLVSQAVALALILGAAYLVYKVFFQRERS